MASEILVNDGGAPARILPFVASAAITAGDFLELHTDGKVRPLTLVTSKALGVALTDAPAANDPVNVITGSGVIVRVRQDDDLTTGNIAMADTGAVGEIKAWANSSGNTEQLCVVLENLDADKMVKVLLF